MVAYGWQMVPTVYAVAMLVTALAFWIFSYTDKAHHVGAHVTMRDQLLALKDPKVWKLCQYYSIVFVAHVALAMWMTTYYITEYGFNIQSAALLAAAFSLPCGVLLAFGGWLSDIFWAHKVTWWVVWVSLFSLFILSYPKPISPSTP